MKKKVAIQGYVGSYHHEAAHQYYGNDIEIIECDTFPILAKVLYDKQVDTAIMAIENTIAGSILPNYALLSKYQLKIVGEVFLSIQHQLMVLKGQKIEDIQEARSHQMALLQCDKFLDQFPHWKIVNDLDTALTAKDIQENQLKHVAAIASKKAAEVYDLEILASSIQTYEDNFTRFFVLEKDFEAQKDFDKVSMRFSTSHETGSLVAVLKEISDLGINIEKLQSMPLLNQPWMYSFYIDIQINTINDYNQLMTRLSKQVADLEILGHYKKGIK